MFILRIVEKGGTELNICLGNSYRVERPNVLSGSGQKTTVTVVSVGERHEIDYDNCLAYIMTETGQTFEKI